MKRETKPLECQALHGRPFPCVGSGRAKALLGERACAEGIAAAAPGGKQGKGRREAGRGRGEDSSLGEVPWRKVSLPLGGLQLMC